MKTVPIKAGRVISEVRYENVEGESTQTINESAVRYLLQKFPLDKIFIFASKKVRGEIEGYHNNFARILDDDILLSVTDAARHGKKILVKCEGKEAITVTPLAIETDFLCSRQYLVALREKKLMRLKIEKITAGSLVKEAAEKFSLGRERLREKILCEELGGRKVEEATGEFIWSLETPNPLHIYPRLWKIRLWAEILTTKLRERMCRDAKEALEKYAEPV